MRKVILMHAKEAYGGCKRAPGAPLAGFQGK